MPTRSCFGSRLSLLWLRAPCVLSSSFQHFIKAVDLVLMLDIGQRLFGTEEFAKRRVVSFHVFHLGRAIVFSNPAVSVLGPVV
jgi:hypothetical protein